MACFVWPITNFATYHAVARDRHLRLVRLRRTLSNDDDLTLLIAKEVERGSFIVGRVALYVRTADLTAVNGAEVRHRRSLLAWEDDRRRLTRILYGGGGDLFVHLLFARDHGLDLGAEFRGALGNVVRHFACRYLTLAVSVCVITFRLILTLFVVYESASARGANDFAAARDRRPVEEAPFR